MDTIPGVVPLFLVGGGGGGVVVLTNMFASINYKLESTKKNTLIVRFTCYRPGNLLAPLPATFVVTEAVHCGVCVQCLTDAVRI